MPKRTRIGAALIGLALSVPARVGAHGTTATLVGCVTDQIRAPVPHAAIELSACRGLDPIRCYTVVTDFATSCAALRRIESLLTRSS